MKPIPRRDLVSQAARHPFNLFHLLTGGRGADQQIQQMNQIPAKNLTRPPRFLHEAADGASRPGPRRFDSVVNRTGLTRKSSIPASAHSRRSAGRACEVNATM